MRKVKDTCSSGSLAGTSGRHATTHECTSASEKAPAILMVFILGTSSGRACMRVCSESGLMWYVVAVAVFGEMRGHTYA